MREPSSIGLMSKASLRRGLCTGWPGQLRRRSTAWGSYDADQASSVHWASESPHTSNSRNGTRLRASTGVVCSGTDAFSVSRRRDGHRQQTSGKLSVGAEFRGGVSQPAPRNSQTSAPKLTPTVPKLGPETAPAYIIRNSQQPLRN